jgi:hypothetical protein
VTPVNFAFYAFCAWGDDFPLSRSLAEGTSRCRHVGLADRDWTVRTDGQTGTLPRLDAELVPDAKQKPDKGGRGWTAAGNGGQRRCILVCKESDKVWALTMKLARLP